MIYIKNDMLSYLATWPKIIKAVEESFTGAFDAPVRTQNVIPRNDGEAITFLTMPAYSVGQYFGIKCATVTSDNHKRDLPAVHATYTLFSGNTGVPLASFNADNMTAWRTAAASALASSYLSRTDSSHLLILGTGRVARQLVDAHATVRPIKKVTVWGRDFNKAKQFATEFSDRDFDVVATKDIKGAVEKADIISAATMSQEPLFDGSWVAQGTHVDLVGSFRPDMRESCDLTLKKANIYVDTLDGCLEEAGDLILGISNGAINSDDICGTLKN